MNNIKKIKDDYDDPIDGILVPRYWVYSGHYTNYGEISTSNPLNLRSARLPALNSQSELIYLSEDLKKFDVLNPHDKITVNALLCRLHIDIDSLEDLNDEDNNVSCLDVVSGTLILFTFGNSQIKTEHFIGKVTLKVKSDNGCFLRVEDFNFSWPETQEMIDRIEIQLWFPLSLCQVK